MKLFHYTDQPYSELLASGVPVNGVRSLAQMEAARQLAPPAYQDRLYTGYLPCFMAPLPYALVPQVFDYQHELWCLGRTLFEYELLTGDQDDFFFFILDAPDVNHAPPERPFLDFWHEMMQQNAYYGTSVDALNAAIARVLHQTPLIQSFREILRRPDIETLKDQYTAGVPVVLLYSSDRSPMHHHRRPVVLA